MKSLSACMACLFLASCGIYNSQFDCPPGKGVGCAPVGEILDLIVEKETGEDLFVKDKGTALLLKQQKKEQEEKRVVEMQPTKLYLVKGQEGEWLLSKSKDGREP